MNMKQSKKVKCENMRNNKTRQVKKPTIKGLFRTNYNCKSNNQRNAIKLIEHFG